MSGGRTMWYSVDVARHRRALMVELKAELGPMALACDAVLCAHAKEQNDGGTIRDGFASLSLEAGVSREDARTFVEAASKIGWLDDLVIDEDGRRFRCRVSGWVADQEKANAAWRQANARARKKAQESEDSDVTDRDESRLVTESHVTAQHSTAQHPLDPPQAGDSSQAPDRPVGKRGREVDTYRAALSAWAATHFPGCDPHGIETLVGFVRSEDKPATPENVREFAESHANFTHLLTPEEVAA
jgi:hypothetical protein